MKNIFKFLIVAFLFACTAMSCKKQEAIDYYLGGKAPVLTSDVTGILPISYVNAANEAVTLTWTNPNYQFTTGTSSQNVNYVIEIDTTGSNFTNPNLKSLGVTPTSSLSYTITQTQLNDIMLNQLVLAVGVPHHLEMRVKATLVNGAALLTSNVLKFVSTPYAIPPKVTPPGTAALGYTDGTLYITGSATPKGWMGGGDAPVPSQQFTQISATEYKITIALIGGQSYTFVPIYGNWNNKYSINTKNDPAEVNGGDFMVGGNDILAPAASGNYVIDVNFQTGKFSVK